MRGASAERRLGSGVVERGGPSRRAATSVVLASGLLHYTGASPESPATNTRPKMGPLHEPGAGGVLRWTASWSWLGLGRRGSRVCCLKRVRWWLAFCLMCAASPPMTTAGS